MTQDFEAVAVVVTVEESAAYLRWQRGNRANETAEKVAVVKCVRPSQQRGKMKFSQLWMTT